MKHSQLRQLIRESIKKEFTGDSIDEGAFADIGLKIDKKIGDFKNSIKRAKNRVKRIPGRIKQLKADRVVKNLEAKLPNATSTLSTPEGPVNNIAAITHKNWSDVKPYIEHLFKTGIGYNISSGARPDEGYTFEEYAKDHEQWPNKGLYFETKEDLIDHLRFQYYYGGTL